MYFNIFKIKSIIFFSFFFTELIINLVNNENKLKFQYHYLILYPRFVF
jgi:hypothetical protein